MAPGFRSPLYVRSFVKLAIASIALPHAVSAQESASSSPAEQADELAEIVVSARLREESLQVVPLSAVVVGEAARTQQNLQSLAELTQTIPSVHIGSNGRSNELYIRGIGSGVNSSFDQSVGTFADGIFHGRSRFTAATFLDLNRIEILKGPQSTFFGNNSIAGAFNIVTQQPGTQFQANTRALYGEDGRYNVEAAAGGPVLGDTLAVRAAATANGMDGWLENLSSDSDIPKEDNQAARLTFLYNPAAAWKFTLKGEVSRNKNEGGFGNQIANCPPPPPFTASGFCSLAIRSGVPLGLDADKVSVTDGQEITLNTVETVLTSNYDRGGHSVTGITGYYNYQYNLNLDPDATPATLFSAQVPERYHQFSQELRIASPAGQRLEYLAGVYFQTGSLFNRQDSSFFFLSPTIGASAPLAPLVPFLPLAQAIGFTQDEKNYSVFGSLNWNITDNLKVSPGIRGSRVTKDFAGSLFYGTATQAYGGVVALPQNLTPLAAALGLGVPYNRTLDRTDDALMPSLSVQYTLNSDAMTYASYTRGFKAGGFNAADTTGMAANQPFDSEYVNAYEVGLKSKLGDGRVLLNLDVFRSDYDDFQVAALQPNAAGTFTSVVKNAAKSRSQGVELESVWAVTRSWRLALQGTYLDSYYVSFPNAGPTSIQQLQGVRVQDLSDRPTQFAPRTSGAATVTFSPTIGSYQLTTEGRAFWSASYYLNGVDDDLIKQGQYTRLDARLSLERIDDRWALDFIGKNLTDRNILTFAGAMATSLGSSLQGKQDPRNYAVQARYRW